MATSTRRLICSKRRSHRSIGQTHPIGFASSPTISRRRRRSPGSPPSPNGTRDFTFTATRRGSASTTISSACLSLVPAAAEFVALSDHDDDWQPDKLATLLAGFDRDTHLVYSDMRIVSADGTVLSDTYWTTRRNNHTNLISLLISKHDHRGGFDGPPPVARPRPAVSGSAGERLPRPVDRRRRAGHRQNRVH